MPNKPTKIAKSSNLAFHEWWESIKHEHAGTELEQIRLSHIAREAWTHAIGWWLTGPNPKLSPPDLRQ